MEKKRKRRKAHVGLILGLTIGLWSGCTVEQDFFSTSHIRTSFDLKSSAAMDGRLTISEAYLKLDRIQVTGSLDGQNNTTLTHSIPPEELPYQLTRAADSAEVNIPVSSRAYDALDLHLYLFTDDYELVFRDDEKTEEPSPVEEPNGGNDGDAAGDDDGGGTGQDEEDQDPGHNHAGDDSGDDTNDDGWTDHADDDGDDGDKHEGDHKHDNDKEEDHKKDKDKGKGDDHDDDRDDDDKEEGNQGDRGDDEDDRDDDEGEDDDQKDDNDHDGRKSGNQNNVTVDLDHFFQNAKPALIIFGLYENNGKQINLIFVATGVEKFTVPGRQNDSNAIILAEENPATVTFDPDVWFRAITVAQIESGETQIYQQQTVLFIHPAHNTELYQALITEIERSTDFNIQLSGAISL